MNLSLHHPVVRDLYWAINSPTLLEAPCLKDWQDSSHWFTHRLQQLDQQPAPLLQHLQQQVHHPHQPRLGQYFEQLWHFYFKHHPDYQLLLHNLQIKAPDNHTLGELDLLIRNRHSHEVFHLELAVKFYLAVPLYPSDNSLACYIGPGLKDRLLDKYQHTCNHQLPLSASDAAQAQLMARQIKVDQAQAVFRGRLFQPLAIAAKNQPAWLPQAELHQLNATETFLCLERRQWFAEQTIEHDSYNYDQLANHLATPLARPFQVAVIDPQTQQETRRLFVVPDSWEAAARDCLHQPL
ncbi:DUF1853 family protein [Nitrincola sp.]|uniref:DUF1853 family protein n=1 Tax=Nitrincola sp. TaxID=1926584 RepID=UPI003A953909